MRRRAGLACARSTSPASRCPPRWCARCTSCPGLARVYNLYGPSEDTTYSTFSAGEPRRGPPPSAGRSPAPGSYVLDAHLQPVPVACTGELYIWRARAWRAATCGRPELTAERFVPDPFAPPPGARLYRTGDLARYRADGPWSTWAGRLPGEDAWLPHRAGRDRSGAGPAPRRCARPWCWPARTAPATSGWWPTSRLHSGPVGRTSASCAPYLRARLPEYMVPSAFVSWRPCPLTPNGKLDRGAARSGRPAPTPPPVHRRRARPWRQALADLWRQLLGLRARGRARRLLRAREATRCWPPRLASRLRSGVRGGAAGARALRGAHGGQPRSRGSRPARRSRAALRPAPGARAAEGALPLSFAQQRLWFLDSSSRAARSTTSPRRCGWRARSTWRRWSAAFDELVRRHESLRTTFPARRGRRPSRSSSPPGPCRWRRWT